MREQDTGQREVWGGLVFAFFLFFVKQLAMYIQCCNISAFLLNIQKRWPQEEMFNIKHKRGLGVFLKIILLCKGQNIYCAFLFHFEGFCRL